MSKFANERAYAKKCEIESRVFSLTSMLFIHNNVKKIDFVVKKKEPKRWSTHSIEKLLKVN